MITLDEALQNNPSERIRTRSAKMVAKLTESWADFEIETFVEVEPDEEGKAVRIVSFKRRYGRIDIECYAKDNLANCPANKVRMLCSHVETAIRHLLETKYSPKELPEHESTRTATE